MMKIGIIIPYYQEEAGILRRCLASVLDQELASPAHITIIVVDDASPVDSAVDIRSIEGLPPHVEIRVVRRPNGGPGAARNTGLDALDADTDLVALIDSDDTWRNDHLQRAITSLQAGADIYFSDHISHAGEIYLPGTGFYSFLRAEADSGQAAGIRETDVLSLGAREVAEFAVNEYLAHTSSIVYSASKLRTIRMSEMLRAAAEDHLFFLDLLLSADKVCVSVACEVTLGAGVNIYEKSFSWGSVQDLKRRTFILGALKIMRVRSDWSAPTRRLIDVRLKAMRRTVGYLLVRKLIADRKIPVSSLRLAWRFDRSAVLFAPANAILFKARSVMSHRSTGPLQQASSLVAISMPFLLGS